jgi:hypothetical protein
MDIYTGGSFIFETAPENLSYKIFHSFNGSTGKWLERKTGIEEEQEK